MRIGEIGNSFRSIDSIDYFSDHTLLEFDMIIMDIDYILGNFVSNNRSRYVRRKENLEEFLLHKKIPIVYITPTPRRIVFSIATKQEVVSFDFFAPIPSFEVIKESGKKIEIINKTPFTEFFKKYEQYFSYKSFFKQNPGILILEAPHTRKILGFYNSQCIFLPAISYFPENEKIFFEDLFNIVCSINSNIVDNPLPEWANEYLLPNEKELRNEIQNIQNDISVLNQNLKDKEKKVIETIAKKKLFTGSGSELEDQVKIIFEELGFEILAVEQNRDDLIVKYKDNIAVVEIKGVTKSSAEKHAAQLEKWSALYYENTGIDPKAILIVNAFKDTPLKERKESAFPHQMINYSTKKEHCLITTLQLLTMYYDVLYEGVNKDDLVKSIFETVGEYTASVNWTKHIDLK